MTDEIVTKEIFEDKDDLDAYGGSVSFMNYMAGAGETIPPWWSQARDIKLRVFTKDSDHLSGTVNTLRDMLVAIPFRVVPRDMSVKSHLKQSDIWTELLLDNTFSRGNLASSGWGIGYGAFVEDYHNQDNGAWFVIEGPGKPDGPIVGQPTKIIHLDSGQVWRTRSREFPIIYTDDDGKRYKIHHTRIINLTSMSSSIQDMYGVGFCAVSRCIGVVQNLIDISRYKQEKLGSRPMRALLHIAGGGQRETKALDNLLIKYAALLDNQGFTRYGKIPIFASSGALSLLDFASLPDGFNELESAQLAMAVLSLAFGVDSRQLAFALGVSGSTKADAEVQHLKMMGKGPGTFIQEFERQVNNKLLPSHLKIVFDYQDDAADDLAAKIRKTRSEGRKVDLESGVTDLTTERQLMLEDGEISQGQFEELQKETVQVEGEPTQSNLEPVRLNGIQVRALRETLQDIKSDLLSRENGIEIIMSIGVPRSNAEAMAGSALGEQAVSDIIEEEIAEEKSITSFGAALRAASRALRTGTFDLVDFIDSVNATVTRGYNQAWIEGAQRCNIEPNERTQPEQAKLNSMIAEAQTHIFGLGEWIQDSEPKPAQINSRLDMWIADYDLVATTSQNMACADSKATWILGATEEHCGSCSGFSGRVYRRSVWAKNGAIPRSRNLECNGYRCDCSLVDTDKRITPGRFPRRLLA